MSNSAVYNLFLVLIFTLLAVFLFNEVNITSFATSLSGIAQVQVISSVEISLPVNSVNFGNVTINTTRNTTQDNPPPFVIRNDGSVKVNITMARDINSQPLFNGTGSGDNTTSFRFKAGFNENDSYDPTCTIETFTNVPGITPIDVICFLKKVDNRDEARIDLEITVPPDEDFGPKNETLVFTASQS